MPSTNRIKLKFLHSIAVIQSGYVISFSISGIVICPIVCYVIVDVDRVEAGGGDGSEEDDFWTTTTIAVVTAGGVAGCLLVVAFAVFVALVVLRLKQNGRVRSAPHPRKIKVEV